MWCPSDLAYTIKKVIVWCDVHLTKRTQLKNILFVVMSIWPRLHNSLHLLKSAFFDVMTI